MTDTSEEDLLDQMERLFVGRKGAFAAQNPEGGYWPVERDVTRDDLRNHVRHVEGCTYGFYVIREDNYVRTVCFDIDLPGAPKAVARAEAQKVWVALREMGVRENAMCVEFSGNKGYHVWVFLAEWIAPLKARAWGDLVLERAGILCEVFPKGELNTESSYGNLVKYPFALHMKSGRPSTVECPPRTVVADHLANIEPLKMREIRRVIYEPQVACQPKRVPPRSESIGDGTLLPCASHIVENGSGRGARNNALYGLALLAKRAGKSRDETVELVQAANERCEPPIPKQEAVAAVRSAFLRKNDTFRCSQDWLHDGDEPHCSAKCPRYSANFGRARQ